jgi:glucose-6-phosphate-specific signal transduction histidine kinase
MTLTAWMDDHHLYVRIEDDGVGLEAPAGNPGLGLGLQLIEAHSTLDITSANGTQLLMCFPRDGSTT